MIFPGLEIVFLMTMGTILPPNNAQVTIALQEYILNNFTRQYHMHVKVCFVGHQRAAPIEALVSDSNRSHIVLEQDKRIEYETSEKYFKC